MPRQARIDAPGALQHIIIRGIERRNIFRDNTDRHRFRDRLGEVLARSGTPCYAWALMPNHVHLLLRTGATTIATVMRRLLTSYAVTFNWRHKRHGHLFQNRYKSVLCQEDPYFLELLRYIHLNPIRGGLVSGLRALESYPFTGHAALMGRVDTSWQDTDYALQRFGEDVASARERYRLFVKEGVKMGRRPELVGGGLIRSLGGWTTARAVLRSAPRIKADERILGDSAFVEEVLETARECLERRLSLRAQGYDLDRVARRAAEAFGLSPDELRGARKNRLRVQARSLLCYWAVAELGMRTTDLARRLRISQPAVSRAVGRGEEIAKKRGLQLTDR